MYSSTCFGHRHAHYQELNNCSSSLWFYRWSVVVTALLVVVGPVEIIRYFLIHADHYSIMHICLHRLELPNSLPHTISLFLLGLREQNTNRKNKNHYHHHHHHHHHVQEGLGLIPVPCILRMKLAPPSLLRSSYVSLSSWFIL
jgi:hypothetical protein